MKRLFILSLPLILILASTLWGQSGVRLIVFSLQPLGVDEVTAGTASNLLKDFLEGTQKFEIITPREDCYSIDCAIQLGRELHADKAVIGKLAKLGDKLLVSLSLLDIHTNRVEFTDRLKSDSVEDLDIVLERAALGISEKKPFRETIAVEQITEAETKEFRTRKPLTVLGIRTGYFFPLGNSFGKVKRGMYTLDCAIHHETAKFIAEASAGFSTAAGASDLHIGLLVYRLLSQKDFTPYLGGGLGVHKFSFEDNGLRDGDGFGLSLGGGVIGFRTYDFRIVFSSKYTIIIPMDNDISVQQGFTLTFGLTTGQ